MMDSDEQDFHGPHDHPVLAALAGCLVLVAAAVLVPRLLAPQPQTLLLAAGAGLGALLWLVGLVATIRHSSALWKLASLAILVGAGVLTGYLVDRQNETGTRADASSFAEIEFGTDGTPVLPADASARGPVSALFAAAVKADNQEQRDFGTALGRLGIGNLNSPYLLARDPKVLADCGAIGALEATAKAQSQARAKRHAELAKAIAAANMSAPAKAGVTTLTGADAAGDDALLANQTAMLAATTELCQLLAKRGWADQSGYFGFASGADKDRFDALAARRKGLAGDAEAGKRAATERSKQGRETVRAALS